ncbi:MAG: hypothetical protein ABI696_18245, partial [Rubrivivax sp.]
AFNLSQDQTLQFDLEFAQWNRSELHFSIHERLRSCDLETCNVNHRPLGTLRQTPTLIGCMLLKSGPHFAALIRNQRRPRF